MNNTILRCKNCGALLVIPTKDLWKIGKSNELESFENAELGDKKDGKHTN